MPKMGGSCPQCGRPKSYQAEVCIMCLREKRKPENNLQPYEMDFKEVPCDPQHCRQSERPQPHTHMTRLYWLNRNERFRLPIPEEYGQSERQIINSFRDLSNGRS